MYLVVPKCDDMQTLGTQVGVVYLEYEVMRPEESGLFTADMRQGIEGAVFFVRSLESANLLATRLAQKNYGMGVDVYKHVGVFESLQPEVIQKEVSDKGILPKARF